jgi:hypothetical protein
MVYRSLHGDLLELLAVDVLVFLHDILHQIASAIELSFYVEQDYVLSRLQLELGINGSRHVDLRHQSMLAWQYVWKGLLFGCERVK